MKNDMLAADQKLAVWAEGVGQTAGVTLRT